MCTPLVMRTRDASRAPVEISYSLTCTTLATQMHNIFKFDDDDHQTCRYSQSHSQECYCGVGRVRWRECFVSPYVRLGATHWFLGISPHTHPDIPYKPISAPSFSLGRFFTITMAVEHHILLDHQSHGIRGVPGLRDRSVWTLIEPASSFPYFLGHFSYLLAGATVHTAYLVPLFALSDYFGSEIMFLAAHGGGGQGMKGGVQYISYRIRGVCSIYFWPFFAVHFLVLCSFVFTEF